jgi:hypothetical protein
LFPSPLKVHPNSATHCKQTKHFLKFPKTCL